MCQQYPPYAHHCCRCCCRCCGHQQNFGGGGGVLTAQQGNLTNVPQQGMQNDLSRLQQFSASGDWQQAQNAGLTVTVYGAGWGAAGGGK